MFLTILHKRYFQFKTISIHIPVGDVLVLPGPECILEFISILIPVGDVSTFRITEQKGFYYISILIPIGDVSNFTMLCLWKERISIHIPIGDVSPSICELENLDLNFNTHPRRGCFRQHIQNIMSEIINICKI